MGAVKQIKGGGGRRKRPRKATRRPTNPLDRARPDEIAWPQVSPIFEAARTYDDLEFVYFTAEADGPLKIGTAKDPIQRLRTMQTGNPRRLRAEYVLVGDRRVERLFQELWEPFAIRSPRAKDSDAPGTEWFEAEIRDTLYPILKTAVAAQVELLEKREDLDPTQIDELVRAAHAEHDFPFHRRHESRRLGQHAGYVISGRSTVV